VIDYDRYNFVLRMAMKAVVGRGGGPTSGRHDLRDWDEIREWTTDVQRVFREKTGQA
jgi:menaquinone-dependent protoporphyrinogen IX oxidase